MGSVPVAGYANGVLSQFTPATSVTWCSTTVLSSCFKFMVGSNGYYSGAVNPSTTYGVTLAWTDIFGGSHTCNAGLVVVGTQPVNFNIQSCT